MTLFAIRDIQENPFRHMDRYPVRRDKIEALKESIATTTFWDNIVAREVDGKAQIAYGHHRLVALQESFDAGHKVRLIVRDLDDTKMLQIMARENLEEWGSNAMVEQETVRATVEAYADGLISLQPLTLPKIAGELRYAPSFEPGNEIFGISFPYTIDSLAQFIGWDRLKVGYALRALATIEQGALTEDDFVGLKVTETQAVTREAGIAARRAEGQGATKEQAREQGKKAARGVRDRIVSGDIGYKEARQVTDRIVPPKPSGAPPHIDDFVMKLAAEINRVMDPKLDPRAAKLEEVAPYWSQVGHRARWEVYQVLGAVQHRIEAYRAEVQFEAPWTEITERTAIEAGGQS